MRLSPARITRTQLTRAILEIPDGIAYEQFDALDPSWIVGRVTVDRFSYETRDYLFDVDVTADGITTYRTNGRKTVSSNIHDALEEQVWAVMRAELDAGVA